MADANDYKDEIAALGKVLSAVADLSAEGQQYVMRSASDRLGFAAPSQAAAQTAGGAQSDGSQPLGTTLSNLPATPKQFLDLKKPHTDLERVTCLAFYLAHKRDTPHWKTADITTLNTEAAQKPLANTSDAINNAQKSGLVTLAGKRGFKQITSFGEKLVNALPDREAVNQAVASEKKRPKRRKTKKKTASK